MQTKKNYLLLDDTDKVIITYNRVAQIWTWPKSIWNILPLTTIHNFTILSIYSIYSKHILWAVQKGAVLWTHHGKSKTRQLGDPFCKSDMIVQIKLCYFVKNNKDAKLDNIKTYSTIAPNLLWAVEPHVPYTMWYTSLRRMVPV